MSNAFAPIVRARPCPIFGRPVHRRGRPLDYSPILLLRLFGFRIAPDTLSSTGLHRRPARHYPCLWIQRPSSERWRDFNPPDSRATQHTIWPHPTSHPHTCSACGLSPSRARPGTLVRAWMKPPRFRAKNVSTCTRSPTARGSSHASPYVMGRCCLLFLRIRSAPWN